MPVSSGNDTVSAVTITSDLDGLGGDDLLILNHPGVYLGYPIYNVELLLYAPFDLFFVAYQITPDPGGMIGNAQFTIRNFERYDITIGDVRYCTVVTGAGDDTLRGSTGNDILQAGGGSNEIYGGGNADSLSVSYGNGVDHIYGGTGNDTIMGAEFDDIVDGGTGVDVLSVSIADFAAGVNADYTLFTTNANWTRIEGYNVTLTNHNDLFRATTLGDRLDGGGGDDDVLILNRTGLAAITLVMSNDAEIRGFERLRFTGSDRVDRVTGTAGNDTIAGGAADDILASGGGSDQIFGGSGNDRITGVDLGDTVGGGAGIDIAIVDFSTSASGIVLGRGQNPHNYSGIEDYGGVLTPFDDIYYGGRIRLELNGGGGHDGLVLDYSTLPNSFVRTEVDFGQFGITIQERHETGNYSYLYLRGWEELDVTGSRGTDWFTGGTGDDTLRGEGGNDRLYGGGGANLIYGGTGNDTILAESDPQTQAYGGSGNDLIQVRGTGVQVDGGRGFDTLSVDFYFLPAGVSITQQGTSGNWTRVESIGVRLTAFDDTADMGFLTNGSGLDGGQGYDTLFLNYSAPGVADSVSIISGVIDILLADGTTGNAGFSDFEKLNIIATVGNDTISISGQAVEILAGAGDDSLKGWVENDLIDGGVGDDTIEGDDAEASLFANRGHDTLRGGKGEDLILGSYGNDLIEGGSENDAIAGEAGNDTIFGGLGSDLFFFEGRTDSGNDRIADYDDASDVIWISGGLTQQYVQVTDVGADKLVSWSAGTLLLIGLGGQTVTLFFDADFL